MSPRALALAAAVLLPLAAVSQGFERESDGVVVPLAGGVVLKLEPRSERIVRVMRAKDRAFFHHPSLMLVPSTAGSPRWEVVQEGREVRLTTDDIQAIVDVDTGRVTFQDRAGRTILAEAPAGATLQPAVVQGVATYHVRQQWEPGPPRAGVGGGGSAPTEALYGLGQHQLGFLNLKGRDLDLWQHNTEVAVPFLVSTRGYGILWDNASYTRFGALRDPQPVPDCTFTPDGHGGGAWEGTLVPKTTGVYIFRPRFTNEFTLWLDGRRLIHRWRQNWLPGIEEAPVALQAGRHYRVRAVWSKESDRGEAALLWKTPAREDTTSLWSQVGGGIDYDFVYGPSLDRVVAGYRELTGTAPLMPIWAFGFWQSRERYRTQAEILDTLAGFRARGIPIDNIVLDWFYWPESKWGSHRFDPARFPDPAAMIRQIHNRYHAHLMISVWPKFYPGTANFKELQSRGLLYQPNLREGLRDWVGYPYTFYDAFSAEGRRIYWNQIERSLFRLGIDAWWLDASEPDLLPQPSLEGTLTHMNPTALGPASRVLNAYPLMHTGAVYRGQLAAAPGRRVFILTRSAFAGQQRHSAATWSGDTTSTWTALRRQIAAGLGFSISGIPYWTMDVGGFAVPARFARPDPDPADAAEWRELNTRWFEFGTFVPILRVHGEFPYREMWQFGGDGSPTYRAELKFDRLRYRLLPYIYSLAAAVTREGSTILRPLAMDFPGDSRVFDLTDEYLFGHALLVSPITEYRARSRLVYLPEGAAWYDFWTGALQAGGLTYRMAAPYGAIPVSVRTGSIVPMGPERLYAAEKPANPITLYVYTGADGVFDLYEDDGLTNAYERGASATIPLRWNEAARTLTIGPTLGRFPGMLTEREFDIVLVTPAKPVGFSFDPRPNRRLRYRGARLSAHFR
ncbi:MAG: TIM-barrel domain-containing protein [Opitutaceae bacterium]